MIDTFASEFASVEEKDGKDRLHEICLRLQDVSFIYDLWHPRSNQQRNWHFSRKSSGKTCVRGGSEVNWN